MSLIERVHGRYVYDRRVRTLCDHLTAVIPDETRVLDVGCGDGLLSRMIMDRRPDVAISGIDVLLRPKTHIPVELFDGQKIPFADNSYDVVMFVDVLHHTTDPMILLRDATRVARRAIVIKDHTRDGLLAGPTLRLMDEVGNARHGVALPFNYWSRDQWLAAFNTLGLTVAAWEKNVGLYPWPASLLFDRSLHFVARLDVTANS
jgi:SAM-dependent methyltransferase